jgi:phosphopantetheinyl transferase (holo-ACP synthase)
MMASGNELQHLNDYPESAISIWTAKEAVQKALHLGMNLNPRKVSTKWPNPIANFAVIIPIGKKQIQLETWQYDDLRISLAFSAKADY